MDLYFTSMTDDLFYIQETLEKYPFLEDPQVKLALVHAANTIGSVSTRLADDVDMLPKGSDGVVRPIC